MADEASRALGAPTVAGTFVNPKGMAKKMTASVAGGQVGGIAGSLATGAIAGRNSGAAQAVPNFGRVGYLAVTDTEVALLGTRTGAFKMKIGDKVLARAPRAEITSAELDQGALLSHLTIGFLNGASWQFDVPRQAKKPAQAVARALGGTDH
ncbi:MAG TPA: hypothetical protein VFN87_02770 [Solirubrobacteraceae bacterium]|nr:hypothetical protein [Solirubrobacteraceae bacterium]